MSVKVHALAVQTESAEPLKVVAYPQELTLMSEYMNEVQAKRFKQTKDFRRFVKSGLNLTVLRSESTRAPSNIVDSGIRLSSTPCQPDAA